MSEHIEMTGVREYAEGLGVELWEVKGRLVVKAWNEAGYNITMVDLLDLLGWLAVHRAELLREAVSAGKAWVTG